MSSLPALPYIPLEVAEDIIDQLIGDIRSLRSCALTCRGWNHHARYLLIASIRIRSREDLYSIRDYITSNPHMSSFVHSLSMIPVKEKKRRCLLEALPVDLLKRLPNLRTYSIVNASWSRISLHATTLLLMKAYLHVEELHLGWLRFRTSAELARLLVALPRLKRLECAGVRIQNIGTDTEQFRDKCNMLSEVTISQSTDVHTIRLILHMSSATLTVLRYSCDSPEDPASTPDLSVSKHLHSLEFFADHGSIESSFQIVSLVTTLIPNTLRKLTITFGLETDTGKSTRASSLHLVDHSLEDALLALGTLSVVISIPKAKRNRLSFWSKIMRSRFPRLHEGKLLHVCGSLDAEVHLGHDKDVIAIAASQDSRYIATGASDGTIIIWSGRTSSQRSLVEIQCPTTSGDICSLHFSDTGEFLMGVCEHDLFVWSIDDGIQITAIAIPGDKYTCAWWRRSVDSLTLSIQEYEVRESRSIYLSATTVHVHDLGMVTASDPQPLFPNDIPNIYGYSFVHRRIVGSSSGLSFAAWSSAGCFFWRLRTFASVPACEAHQFEIGHPRSYPTCASFIGDTQLVLGFRDGTIRWWDIPSSSSMNVEPSSVLSVFPRWKPVATLCVSPLHSFIVAVGDQEADIPLLRRTSGNTHTAQAHLGNGLALHIVLRGHTQSVNDACFSPCERYIATASNDGTVRLWSTRDGEPLWTFRDHSTSEVMHVIFTPDGRSLASADGDGRVCIRLLAMFVREAVDSSVGNT